MKTIDPATVTLDVREHFRSGRPSFALILETVTGLKEDQGLRLIAPFQPLPLFTVMAQRGFAHASRLMDSGDWEVQFTRTSKASPRSGGSKPSLGLRRGPRAIDVDARGLEPPQPLIVILEALASLPTDVALRAHTDRRPMHLYAQLAERGFTGVTEEHHDGSFITTIRPA